MKTKTSKLGALTMACVVSLLIATAGDVGTETYQAVLLFSILLFGIATAYASIFEL